jgi:hypothetical protein
MLLPHCMTDHKMNICLLKLPTREKHKEKFNTTD